MKLLAVSALCLWGALCLCASVNASTASMYDVMKTAAVSYPGVLPCGTWDCDCAFQRQRGCCCVANKMYELEESTFMRMVRLWSSLTDLQSQVVEVTEHKVSFTAAMSVRDDCFGPYTGNTPISYNTITLNQGFGYNPSLGIFTAPVSGVYFLSAKVYSNAGASGERLYFHVRMMLNGSPILSTWEDNREDQEDSGNMVVLLSMNRGDQVYMELSSGRSLCGNNREQNVFTGYLIYPAEEE